MTRKTLKGNSGISLCQAAIIAGIGLFIMTIIAPIANFSILQKIIVPDDVVKTFDNLLNSEASFRLAILFFLMVAVLDIIIAWALYIFFKPFNKDLSLLTAWLRIVYATVLVVISIQLINVLNLINGTDYLLALSKSQIETQSMMALDSFNRGWEFSLIIFGFHLLLLGYLALKAGYMKRILGILIIIAALGYLVDGTGKLLSANYQADVAVYTFAGELLLMFWLLIKGRKIKPENIDLSNSTVQ